MSTTCDCDKKISNGGTCDSSCPKESLLVAENDTSPVSFAPILAATKVASNAVERVSFESCKFGPNPAAGGEPPRF